jgi:hypothetical protein
MLKENMRTVYKRLLMLALLTACLAVFSSSNLTEKVSAAKCIQDCAPDQAVCYDACAEQCGIADPNCNGCIEMCDTIHQNCQNSAVWCSSGGYSYTPNCQVGYADHCPILNGQPNCTDAHSGYYELCNYGPGGQPCVACPGGELCTGANGAPPCP